MSVDPQTLVKAAVHTFEQRDRDRAASVVAYLVQERAPIGPEWKTIAQVARATEETNLALAAQHMFIADNPQDLRRQWELCVMLLQYGRVDDALSLSQRLVSHAPQAPTFHQLLGNAYAQAGKIDLAREAFARGLALKPDVAESWLAYAQLKSFAPNDPDIERMREIILAMPPALGPAKGRMHYALGKALDDAGDTDSAFAQFEAGARLISNANNANRPHDDALVDALVGGWSDSFAQTLTPSSETDDGVIFVLGLPRSGMALAEQILVSHNDVAEGAETTLFPKAALAFPDFAADTVRAVVRDPRWENDVWSKVARAYLHLMRERLNARSGRLVDRAPDYALYLGAIAHALPRAKFIWMRRDPAATAWSCYRTCFGGPQNWSWSLTDIGNHFRLHDRLRAHWTGLHSDRILSMQYEDLVREPNVWIPRMLAFVGLQDEPQTRDFHKAQRNVRTASTSQVRLPLYTSALDNWRRYETRMKPFFDAYAAG